MEVQTVSDSVYELLGCHLCVAFWLTLRKFAKSTDMLWDLSGLNLEKWSPHQDLDLKNSIVGGVAFSYGKTGDDK